MDVHVAQSEARIEIRGTIHCIPRVVTQLILSNHESFHRHRAYKCYTSHREPLLKDSRPLHDTVLKTVSCNDLLRC